MISKYMDYSDCLNNAQSPNAPNVTSVTCLLSEFGRKKKLESRKNNLGL